MNMGVEIRTQLVPGRVAFFSKFCEQCGSFWILREINFGESKSSKTTVFAILGALNFVDLLNFSLPKSPKFMKFKIKRLQM